MMRTVDWNTPVQYLKTVGPVRARSLGRLGIETVGDLLRHYPRAYLDRSTVSPIARLKTGEPATIEGEVLTAGERHSRTGRWLQTVTVADPSGVLFCVWFGQRYLLKQFRSGVRVMMSGLVQQHAGRKQLVHPDFEILDGQGDQLHTGRLVPQYPLTQGIGQHWLRRLIHQALQQVAAELPETLPADLLARLGLPGRADAIGGIHFPAGAAERDAARRRLAFEEILLIQLAMQLRRGSRLARPGIRLGQPGDLTRRLVQSLPFTLTRAQRRVLAEILADLRSGRVMHRLLQGDVGSGKTLVALIAALFVVEQGYQALIMAPTEVLARQHGEVMTRLAAGVGVTVATLTGATPAAERRAILTALGRGEIDLLVGTHALLEGDVDLPRLALAVVDEQHRFGVRQRGRSARTGDEDLPVHVLVMSATPIPRSLSLTLYGDLDLSLIDELPAGRRPIRTLLAPAGTEEDVYARVRDELRAGRQAYIVFPVIEETEGQDLKAATTEFERLAAGPFADFRVALLHGRQRPRDKDAIMTGFSGGELDVLVATTVIEVGIDVPNATAMVIHHPERFGLAQLHQLRGRIGRGVHASRCWLVTDRWLPGETAERIRFFAGHQDGFALAEEDLRRRGPGDAWGVRQHGAPGFRLANPLRDAEMVKECAAEAAAILRDDPDLTSTGVAVLRRALTEGFGDLVPFAAG